MNMPFGKLSSTAVMSAVDIIYHVNGFLNFTLHRDALKRGVQLELCTDIGMRFFVFKVRII